MSDEQPPRAWPEAVAQIGINICGVLIIAVLAQCTCGGCIW